MSKRVLILAVLLYATPSAATAAGDAILAKMAVEQFRQGLQFSQQLSQLRSALDTARQQYQLARQIYAGVEELRTFDADRFLREAATSFLQAEPLIHDSSGFAHDVLAQGLRGEPFDPRALKHKLDPYFQANRRSPPDVACPGDPRCPKSDRPGDGSGWILCPGDTRCPRSYDQTASLGLSDEIETAIRSAEFRRRLTAPAPSSATEGLLAYDIARSDPSLLALYMHMRAESAETSSLAIDLYKRSLTASPGQAQQIQAQAAALTAKQLARIADKEAKALVQQELARTQQAAEAAMHRADTDALWNQISTQLSSPRSHPEPPMPSLMDK